MDIRFFTLLALDIIDVFVYTTCNRTLKRVDNRFRTLFARDIIDVFVYITCNRILPA